MQTTGRLVRNTARKIQTAHIYTSLQWSFSRVCMDSLELGLRLQHIIPPGSMSLDRLPTTQTPKEIYPSCTEQNGLCPYLRTLHSLWSKNSRRNQSHRPHYRTRNYDHLRGNENNQNTRSWTRITQNISPQISTHIGPLTSTI